MKFRKIISKSWKLSWNNKALWAFAFLPFLPSFLLRLYAMFAIFLQNLYLSSGQSDMATAIEFPRWITNFAVFLLSPISEAGIIMGLQKALHGRKIKFNVLFRKSLRFFWRLLFLPFIITFSIIPFSLPLLVAYNLIEQSGSENSLICLIPFILVAVIVFFLLVLEFIFASILIVTEDNRLGLALSTAWSTFWKNLNRTLGSLVIFSALIFGAGIILSEVYKFIHTIFISSIVSSIGMTASRNNLLVLMTINLLGFVYYVASSLLSVFTNSLWLLAFLQLRRKRG
jgi:hypothetical protein